MFKLTNEQFTIAEIKKRLESVGLPFDELESGADGVICLAFETNDEEYKLKDIGDTCIDCRETTEWGSGKFVNRIPADDGIEAGYLCAECAEDDMVLSPSIMDNEAWN